MSKLQNAFMLGHVFVTFAIIGFAIMLTCMVAVGIVLHYMEVLS